MDGGLDIIIFQALQQQQKKIILTVQGKFHVGKQINYNNFLQPAGNINFAIFILVALWKLSWFFVLKPRWPSK